MKNILHIYHDDNNKTYDSARSNKTKRSITQRRSNRSTDKKKKKLSFKNPLVETINIQSYKSWTRKMYIMPTHGLCEVERTNHKCCENSLCIIF
jgi:hypothetical protein